MFTRRCLFAAKTPHSNKELFSLVLLVFVENCGSAHDSITEGARARDRGRESSSFTAPSGNFPN